MIGLHAELRRGCGVFAILAVSSWLFLPHPAAAQANAVSNGDFEESWYTDGSGVPPPDQIPSSWSKDEGSRYWEYSSIGPQEDNGPSLPGMTAVHWTRSNGSGTGDWTIITQTLGISVISVADHPNLTLSLDLKVLFHDLGGGGWMPNEAEYPVTVRVYFTDTAGVQRYWQFGWYEWWDDAVGQPVNGYQTPSGGIVFTEQVDYNQWYTRSFDLLAQLRTLSEPRTIDGVWVGGSGWDFEGEADNVAITEPPPVPVVATTWGAIKAAYK